MKIKCYTVDLCKMPSNQSVKDYLKNIKLEDDNVKSIIIDVSFLEWLKIKLIRIINKIKKLCTEVK